MARKHGRDARLYMAIAAGGEASPVPFITTFELGQSTDRIEVTAWLDATKTYLAGIPDASGTFAGFFDDETQQMYLAGADGVARKIYFYPSTDVLKYFFGTAFFDQTTSFAVDAAEAISGNWNAATSLFRYPAT